MSVEPLNREEVEDLFETLCKRLEANTDKQAACLLKKADGSMCCLGVLLTIVMEKFPRIPIECKFDEFDDSVYAFNGDTINIPDDIIPLIGIQSDEPRYAHASGYPRPITCDNDSGKTFPEIAQILRKHKTELFPILRENP